MHLTRRPLLMLLPAIGFTWLLGSGRQLDAGWSRATAHTAGPTWLNTNEGEALASSSGNGGGGSGFAYSMIDEFGRQRLGVRASGTGTEDGFHPTVQSTATWSDRVAIGGADTPAYLNFWYYVTGGVSAGGKSAFADFFLEARSPGAISVWGGEFKNVAAVLDEATEDPYDIKIIEESGAIWNLPDSRRGIYFQVPLSYSGIGEYTITARSYITVIAGSASSNFAHTALFERVTLPDGRTPEEAGYTLTFDSGLTSPNLASSPAAVPEPSSLALLGMGITGLCGYRSRRKRNQAA